MPTGFGNADPKAYQNKYMKRPSVISHLTFIHEFINNKKIIWAPYVQTPA